MHKKPARTSLITLALAGVAAEAVALGFGPSSGSATLGQALDHTIGIRLEAGEFVAAECVSAEVQQGDQRLPPTSVRTRLEGEGGTRTLRVVTTTAIDEPVVTVTVSVGCPTRLSRRFLLLADPPAGNAPSLPVPLPADAQVPAEPVRAAPEARATFPVPTAAPASAPEAVSPVTPAAAQPAPAPRRPAVRRAAPPATEPGAAPVGRSRLKLDPEPTPVARITAELIEAAASAAAAQAAAKATEEAASANAARIASLEASIERMRADSAADREALKVLRQRAAEGDSAGHWLPWLGGAVLLLAALAAWLGLKLRRLQAERQQDWWNAGATAGAATIEPTAVGLGASPPATRRVEAGEPLSAAAPTTSGNYSSTRPGALGPMFAADLPGDGPSTEPPMLVTERTQPLPVGWREETDAPRDVSIEELIDLEQQAEFFIVLGQEEAAIDLLVDHLRSTGGGSPMPYLKLLEVYRRRGDHEAYERTRARFNHRFNAYAPDWDTDAHEGRSLEDYPNIVARLQMAWPSPIDAMAELETLLFRKTKGDLFDMPAYRDVLFLYSLARDLLDREPLESGNVDVLLPISEGSHHTQPMSLDDGLDGLDSGLVALDNQPTVPVDLDVTQPVMPDSLFNEPTDPGIPRRRR